MTPPPTLDDLIRLVQQDTATDDRLEQLRTAALTVRQLTETGDAVLGHYVDQARAGGHTWTEISSVLGVTKQAVHKRFTAGPASRASPNGRSPRSPPPRTPPGRCSTPTSAPSTSSSA